MEDISKIKSLFLETYSKYKKLNESIIEFINLNYQNFISVKESMNYNVIRNFLYSSQVNNNLTFNISSTFILSRTIYFFL